MLKKLLYLLLFTLTPIMATYHGNPQSTASQCTQYQVKSNYALNQYYRTYYYGYYHQYITYKRAYDRCIITPASNSCAIYDYHAKRYLVAYQRTGYPLYYRYYLYYKSLYTRCQTTTTPVTPDTTIPVITILGDNPVTVNVGDTYTDAGATALDAVDGNLTNKIDVNNTVDTTQVGTYKVTYTVVDNAGNEAIAERTVNVLGSVTPDTTPPVITILGDNPVTVNVGDTYTDAGATAIDAVDGNLSDKIDVNNTVDTTQVGTYKVIYTVVDNAGNEAIAERTVNVLVSVTPDTTPPVITLIGENPVTLTVGDSYIEAGATALDAVDGNLSDKIDVNNTVDTTQVGTYKVTYTVVDNAGNEAIAERTVKVIEAEKFKPFIISALSGTSDKVYFSIQLAKQPTSDVTINYKSADESVVKTEKNQLIFTSANWYEAQRINVDILDKQKNTHIAFEASGSTDTQYNNKPIEDVPIVSHLIEIEVPYDKIFYSEFDMAVPLNIHYVGDARNDINLTLEDAPSGMTLDKENNRLLWKPSLSDEGQTYSVAINITDGTQENKRVFDIYVAQPRLLNTTIDQDTLTIDDSTSTLNGMTIKALDGAVLSEYKIYALPAQETPDFPENESLVGEALLVKGNIGKNVRVSLPLKGLVSQEDLFNFHGKYYVANGQWRTGFDEDFEGTLDNPVYVWETKELTALIAFTVTQKNSNPINPILPYRPDNNLTAQPKSEITCIPKNYRLGSILNFNHQICTFENNQNFKLRVKNHSDVIFKDNNTQLDIIEFAKWIKKAQESLEKLKMSYSNTLSVDFLSIAQKGYAEQPYFGNFFLDRNRLTTTKMVIRNKQDSIKDAEATTVHEYFHLSQYIEMDYELYFLNFDDHLWYLEATAIWFENHIDNTLPSYRAWLDHQLINFLEGGLILKGGPFKGEKYANGVFIEMLEGHCTNFDIKSFFTPTSGDTTYGFENFTNVLSNLQCNFGTPFGNENKNSLETKLLYYQYISKIKRDQTLINPHDTLNLKFERTLTLTKDSWNTEEKPFELKQKIDIFNPLWVDTMAKTIKVEKLPNDKTRQCTKQYIHISSTKDIIISVASNQPEFPDTTEKLGDMKHKYYYLNKGNLELPLSELGATPGSSTAPEMYITLIDPYDGNELDLKKQEVSLKYSIDKFRLSHSIDDLDICNPNPSDRLSYVDPTVKGEIPKRYRKDKTNPKKYIDFIVIRSEVTGKEFKTEVGSDGKWSKKILISFDNKGKSQFHLDGYNKSNLNNSIVREYFLISEP